MKKGAIIGIAIAIIIAGGLGIYAVSNPQEGPLANESSIGLDDEATATVQPDFGIGEGENVLGLEDRATATVEPPATEEEDSDEGKGDSFGFEDRATATVVEP